MKGISTNSSKRNLKYDTVQNLVLVGCEHKKCRKSFVLNDLKHLDVHLCSTGFCI